MIPRHAAAMLSYAGIICVMATGAVAGGDAAIGRQMAGQCAGCHGIDGVAKRPDVPHIGGESEIYLKSQLEAFRAGDRHHEQMSIIAQGLQDEDIAHLIAWYSSIRFSVTLPD
jgi:cytochrome c553